KIPLQKFGAAKRETGKLQNGGSRVNCNECSGMLAIRKFHGAGKISRRLDPNALRARSGTKCGACAGDDAASSAARRADRVPAGVIPHAILLPARRCCSV